MKDMREGLRNLKGEGYREREVGVKDMGEGEKRSDWIEKGMKLGEISEI
jgi:hypothetical protein